MSISPTTKYTDTRGYEYVEASDWLKQMLMWSPLARLSSSTSSSAPRAISRLRLNCQD